MARWKISALQAHIMTRSNTSPSSGVRPHRSSSWPRRLVPFWREFQTMPCVRSSPSACATGIAFQINDDLLDLLADANDADLNDGDRRTRRRPSLPLLYLERSGSPKGLARLHAWRRLKGPPGEITQLLLDEGVLSLVRATQQRLTDAAIHALEGLAPSEARTALDAFTRSLSCALVAAGLFRPRQSSLNRAPKRETAVDTLDS